MFRKLRSLLAVVIAALACSVNPAGAQDNQPRRPNVLFILVDDLRFDQLGIAGHPVIKTPNIDRLGREGAVLRNAFVTTPLCSPSRASFFTGQYAHTHGIVGNETLKLRNFATDDQLVTYPMVLQTAGYITAHVGKWHMDDHGRPRKGFDHWASYRGQGVYNDGEWNVDGASVQTKGYVTDVTTDYAEAFIRRNHAGKPWCLSIGHKAVHGPWTPAERHKDLYEQDAVPRAPSIHDDWSGKPVLWREGEGGTTRPAVGSKNPRLNPSDKTVRDTWRCLAAVDDSVGRLLKVLEETGQLDDTMIVFTGDNGLFYSEHRLVDKRPAYEESIRVPMLARFPRGIAPGTTPAGMALNVDIMATFCELAGVQPPPNHGRSLMPLLSGASDVAGRDAAMFEYFQEAKYPQWPDWRAVRTDRYKLIHYLGQPQFDELYDLQNDRYEMTNLISDPAHAEVARQLRQRLVELERETQTPARLPPPIAPDARN